MCEIEISTQFSGTYTPTDLDLAAAPVVAVMLEFRKDVLLDEMRQPDIVAALLSFANFLNELCYGPLYVVGVTSLEELAVCSHVSSGYGDNTIQARSSTSSGSTDLRGSDPL